jgi:hypothetical protein
MCCSAARCRATTYKGAGIPIYKPFPKMEAGSTKVLLRLRLTSVLNFPFLKWISWRGAVLGCIPHPRARLSKQKQLQCWAHFDGCAGYGRPLRRALMDQPSAAVLRHGGGLGRRELRSMSRWPPGGRTHPPSVVRRTLHPSRRTPCILLSTCLPPATLIAMCVRTGS